ncbi:hypothetical protein WJX82_010704 [Trebouxia sp. C0006]
MPCATVATRTRVHCILIDPTQESLTRGWLPEVASGNDSWLFASAAAAEGASKDDWAPAAALLGLPAIQARAAMSSQQSTGERQFLCHMSVPLVQTYLCPPEKWFLPLPT